MRLKKLVLATLALVPLLAAALMLPSATPAAAHSNKINLAVAGDGATGVTVQATYADDGHPLETMLRLVINATADSGEVVGPIQLNPAGEGQGFYATGPLLSPGRWQVTVAAPEPHPAKVMVVVEAKDAQAAPQPAATATAVEQPTPGSTSWLWWVAGAALAGAAAAVVALARRRT